MRSATYDPGISTVRADALFASALQCSDDPSAAQVGQAIAVAGRAFGTRGCAARVAQAYGDHPETAVMRMRWALEAAAAAFEVTGPESAHCLVPGQRTALSAGRAA